MPQHSSPAGKITHASYSFITRNAWRVANTLPRKIQGGHILEVYRRCERELGFQTHLAGRLNPNCRVTIANRNGVVAATMVMAMAHWESYAQPIDPNKFPHLSKAVRKITGP